MSWSTVIPTFAEFLDAPLHEVAAVAPPSVIMAVGGSRRAAALAGVDPTSDAYAEYTRLRMLEMVDCLFRHGMTHIFTPAIRPGQLAEAGPYRANLLRWNAEGLAGEQALAEYVKFGWRVRLIGVEEVPELHETAARLVAATPRAYTHTLWWMVNRSAATPWERILEAAGKFGATNQQDLIQAIYGEAIPPVTMLVSFGKPMIVPDIVPPELIGDMQCYWYQRPGYSVDPTAIRRMLYDYAFHRKTWQAQRDQRYTADLLSVYNILPTSRILGIGRRIANDFWFPEDEQ
jgi:hypothetical protein